MTESADISKLKGGDEIEVEWGGLIMKGNFIRFYEGDIRFLVLGSVVTIKPNRVTYINGVAIIQEVGK